MSQRRDRYSSRNALRENKIALETEGFDIQQSFSLFKNTKATTAALPGQRVFKDDVFKYVGAIEEDYGVRGRVGASISNPTRPPDEFDKLMDLVPENLFKPNPTLEKRKGGALDTFIKTHAVQIDEKGNISSKQPMFPGGDERERFGSGLVAPVSRVRLPDKESHDQAGLIQSALINFQNNVNSTQNPMFQNIPNFEQTVLTESQREVQQRNLANLQPNPADLDIFRVRDHRVRDHDVGRDGNAVDIHRPSGPNAGPGNFHRTDLEVKALDRFAFEPDLNHHYGNIQDEIEKVMKTNRLRLDAIAKREQEGDSGDALSDSDGDAAAPDADTVAADPQRSHNGTKVPHDRKHDKGTGSTLDQTLLNEEGVVCQTCV